MNSFWKSARNSFFAGLVAVVPIAGSLIILLWLFNMVTDVLLPRFAREQLETLPYPEFLFRVLALVIVVALVTMVGWVTRLVVGKRLQTMMETLLGRVPLLNKVYAFMKEVSHTMLGGKKTMFQRVVLVEYPRVGIYSLGFVTNEFSGEAEAKTGKGLISVFFPTTPNPTSGWLALIPQNEVVALDMSVAEAIKMIISGGTIVPPHVRKDEGGSLKDDAPSLPK